MAGKNTAQVVIGGKVITLGGYESSDYLHKVANYMNGKLEEFNELPGYARQPMETKHMLLSLNISDDFFKAKKQAEVLEHILNLAISKYKCYCLHNLATYLFKCSCS